RGGLSSVQQWLRPEPVPETTAKEESALDLVQGQPALMDVKPSLAKGLVLRTAEAALPAPRSLELAGSLAFDSGQMARVRARFAGEVVELGQTQEAGTSASGETEIRALRLGDRVRKGQVLAVVWSSALGEKKSDLIDALSMLRLDRDNLARLIKAESTGAVA